MSKELEVKEQLEGALKALGDQKASIDQFIVEQTKLTAEGKETNAKAVEIGQKAAEGLTDAVKRIVDIEQKMAENIKLGRVEATESVGELFAKSDAVKNFFNGTSSRARLEFKHGLHGADEQKNTIVNADATTPPQRNGGIIPGATRKLTVLDVIPTLKTTANVIESTREATATLAAAETDEGSSKPESALTFELVTTNIRTIAHWIKISKQLAADAPSLASYINTRMAYGVDKKRDSQIVVGAGTGVQISGITKTGNFTAFTPVSANDRIANLALMISALQQADYNPSAILLNPADLWAINMIKTTDGIYVYGNPQAGPNSGIWGLPTIASNSVPVGKAIVADFYEAYQWWDRMGTVVEMFEQDDVNVQKNLITVRAEARGALETRLPAAALYGSIQA